MGVIGVGTQAPRGFIIVKQIPLVERIEKLKKPFSFAQQRIFKTHLPGAGPDEQALMVGLINLFACH